MYVQEIEYRKPWDGHKEKCPARGPILFFVGRQEEFKEKVAEKQHAYPKLDSERMGLHEMCVVIERVHGNAYDKPDAYQYDEDVEGGIDAVFQKYIVDFL